MPETQHLEPELPLKMHQSLIGFGSNCGLKSARSISSPDEIIVHSFALLESAGFAVVAVSSLWRSPAWPPGCEAPPYFNAVALLQNGQADGLAVLRACQDIEARLGRIRDPGDQWASRTLDLDVLDFGGQVLKSDELILPHPRISQRAFVLRPLLEILPDWRDPRSGVIGGVALDALLIDQGLAGNDARATHPISTPVWGPC